MTLGVVDTTVLIHLFRSNSAAQRWIASQQHLAITVILSMPQVLLLLVLIGLLTFDCGM